MDFVDFLGQQGRRKHAGLGHLQIPEELIDIEACELHLLGNFLGQTSRVAFIENGKVRAQTGPRRFDAQDAQREPMEGSDPGFALDRRVTFADVLDHRLDALAHFPGSLVGEGHHHDRVRIGAHAAHLPGHHQMDEAPDQGTGLPRPRTGDDHDRVIGLQRGRALLVGQGPQVFYRIGGHAQLHLVSLNLNQVCENPSQFSP